MAGIRYSGRICAGSSTSPGLFLQLPASDLVRLVVACACRTAEVMEDGLVIEGTGYVPTRLRRSRTRASSWTGSSVKLDDQPGGSLSKQQRHRHPGALSFAPQVGVGQRPQGCISAAAARPRKSACGSSPASRSLVHSGFVLRTSGNLERRAWYGPAVVRWLVVRARVPVRVQQVTGPAGSARTHTRRPAAGERATIG